MVGMPVYATVDDYAEYMGAPTPEFPTRFLARASRAVDKALVGARYDVDDDGLPTDADLLEVLRNATCAQAHPWVKKWLCHQQPASGEGKSSSTGEASTYYMDRIRVENSLQPEALDILLAAGLIPARIRMRG